MIFLGDGEDTELAWLQAATDAGGQVVGRIPKNTLGGEPGDLAPYALKGLTLQPDEQTVLDAGTFPGADFGPVLIVGAGERSHREALYLESNRELPEDALLYYQKRRGFPLAPSLLSVPERLERWLLATCLAYIWRVCLGVGHEPSNVTEACSSQSWLWLEPCSCWNPV